MLEQRHIDKALVILNLLVERAKNAGGRVEVKMYDKPQMIDLGRGREGLWVIASVILNDTPWYGHGCGHINVCVTNVYRTVTMRCTSVSTDLGALAWNTDEELFQGTAGMVPAALVLNNSKSDA